MSDYSVLNEIQNDYKNPKKPKKTGTAKSKKKKTTLGKKISKTLVKVGICFIGIAYIGESYAGWRAEYEWQFPLEWVGFVREIEKEVVEDEKKVEEIEIEIIPAEEPKAKKVWTGEASYYSFDGCIGCNAERRMANGEILDDMRKTLAFNELPMNTEVVVTNLSNGQKTTATITDTGGFDKLGRIADLSVATKQIIGCNDLCQVRIELF